jgi:succinoglycan biosynthesis protein ExoM
MSQAAVRAQAQDECPHITVCVCTFRRPQMLARLLERLRQLMTNGEFTYGVVVVDNDPAASARGVAQQAASTDASMPIVYIAEPVPNIARARNAALRAATGSFVAFIDDDEFPDPQWLAALLQTLRRFDCTGVLGPVRPHFDEPPPRWVIDGRFCERPEHPTGDKLAWGNCRTGNVLLRREHLPGGEAFQEVFARGGEDSDFFLRMTQAGREFRWCNEAVVHESVPPERWRRSYMLRRALLRGSLTMDLPGSHLKYLARAVIAVPAYVLAIPVASIAGAHAAMKYGIRLCDHLGVLMAACGIRPVRER